MKCQAKGDNKAVCAVLQGAFQAAVRCEGVCGSRCPALWRMGLALRSPRGLLPEWSQVSERACSLSQKGEQFGALYSEASSLRQFGGGHWLVTGYLSPGESASRETSKP